MTVKINGQETFYDLKERNIRAKELKSQGFTVVKSSLGNQLISRGGIGTGQPHIENWHKVYMLTYF